MRRPKGSTDFRTYNQEDLDALLDHLRGGNGGSALRPELGRRVGVEELGEGFALSPGRYLSGTAPKARPQRTMQAVLSDTAASAEGLARLLDAIAERVR